MTSSCRIYPSSKLEQMVDQQVYERPGLTTRQIIVRVNATTIEYISHVRVKSSLRRLEEKGLVYKREYKKPYGEYPTSEWPRGYVWYPR